MKTNPTYRTWLCALALLAFTFQLSAQDTGWLSPTATGLPNGWTTPGNAYKSDDLYTTVIHGSGCRCPFLDLTWNASVNFTSQQLVGPYGTTDSYDVAGSPTDLWGHSWTPTELNNTNFLLRISNPSTLIKQGYVNFNFNIPSTATVLGIEVQVEEHGDANYTMEFVDLIQARVYYSLNTQVHEAGSSFNSSISVSPNPAKALVHIVAGDKFGNIQQVTIMDMQGKVVIKAMEENKKSFDLSTSELHSGIYLLQVSDELGNISSEKIIIE